jgi:hypothetical protein
MIVLPIIIEGIQTRKDKTIGVRIGTQELTPDQASELIRLNQQYCFCALKSNDFLTKEKEILENADASLEDKGKSQSQRLRAVLYVLWQQEPEGFKDFETFYHHRMETIINKIKNRLS